MNTQNLIKDFAAAIYHYISNFDIYQKIINGPFPLNIVEINEIENYQRNLDQNFEQIVNLIRIILDEGIDFNDFILNMMSPVYLTLVISRNNLTLLELFLDSGLNINGMISGQTLLYYAITDDRITIVKYLLERGADPNLSGENMLTPFQKAAVNESPNEILISLVKAGANIDVRIPYNYIERMGVKEAYNEQRRIDKARQFMETEMKINRDLAILSALNSGQWLRVVPREMVTDVIFYSS